MGGDRSPRSRLGERETRQPRWKSLAGPHNVKDRVAIGPIDSASGFIPQRADCWAVNGCFAHPCSQQRTHNGREAEATQMSTARRSTRCHDEDILTPVLAGTGPQDRGAKGLAGSLPPTPNSPPHPGLCSRRPHPHPCFSSTVPTGRMLMVTGSPKLEHRPCGLQMFPGAQAA